HTRLTRPTSPSAKREAQGFPPRHLQSAKLTGRRFAALEPSGAAGWAGRCCTGRKMRRSKTKFSEGSRAVEDERTSEAKWPQGAASAARHFGARGR
ncbi:MAG: hypothetical protein J6N18_12830, partial [Kiritimatiellae bacterium]|nr:hypothetical protein [Kiritimatiellia bacterium]